VVKLVKNNGQFKLTVPVDLVRDKGWNAGTRFRFIEDALGNITLKAIEPQTKDSIPSKPRGGKQ